MEQLSGLDSLMVLAETSKVPLHIGALFIYDPATSPAGSFTYSEVVAHVGDVIDASLPMLKSRVKRLPLNIDSPYWVVDEDFNINFHLERLALPRPANWDELYSLVGQFHAQPLNMDRPLWQAQFIEGLDHVNGIPKGSVALLLKIHHALADGKTAVKIFSALHSLSSEKNAELIFAERHVEGGKYASPNFMKMYSRAYWHTLTSPVKFMASATKLTSKLIFSPPVQRTSYTDIPKTSFNTTPSAQRIIRHIQMPMDELQELEKASGSTINDIALCVISGALRHYLQNCDTLPDGSLHAVLPVDVRVDKKLETVGNQLSFINLNLASNISDAKSRLALIHAATHEAKEEVARVGKQSFMSLANHTYSGILAWGARGLVKSKYIDNIPLITNTIITNVPGIPVPCYLCGAKLVDYVGFGPLMPTLSLFHVVSSIDAHVNVSFQTCDDGVVNSREYASALEESYQELLAGFNIGIKNK